MLFSIQYRQFRELYEASLEMAASISLVIYKVTTPDILQIYEASPKV